MLSHVEIHQTRNMIRKPCSKHVLVIFVFVSFELLINSKSDMIINYRLFYVLCHIVTNKSVCRSVLGQDR